MYSQTASRRGSLRHHFSTTSTLFQDRKENKAPSAKIVEENRTREGEKKASKLYTRYSRLFTALLFWNRFDARDNRTAASTQRTTERARAKKE